MIKALWVILVIVSSFILIWSLFTKSIFASLVALVLAFISYKYGFKETYNLDTEKKKISDKKSSVEK